MVSLCSCLDFHWWWTITCNQINAFLPHISFSHWLYHSNRKQTKKGLEKLFCVSLLFFFLLLFLTCLLLTFIFCVLRSFFLNHCFFVCLFCFWWGGVGGKGPIFGTLTSLPPILLHCLKWYPDGPPPIIWLVARIAAGYLSPHSVLCCVRGQVSLLGKDSTTQLYTPVAWQVSGFFLVFVSLFFIFVLISLPCIRSRIFWVFLFHWPFLLHFLLLSLLIVISLYSILVSGM